MFVCIQRFPCRIQAEVIGCHASDYPKRDIIIEVGPPDDYVNSEQNEKEPLNLGNVTPDFDSDVDDDDEANGSDQTGSRWSGG